MEILAPLGALYYNTGRYDEALQVYREAVSLQPENTDIWLALVSIHHKHGARKDFHTHLKIRSVPQIKEEWGKMVKKLV